MPNSDLEYRFVPCDGSLEELEKVVNKLATEGWQYGGSWAYGSPVRPVIVMQRWVGVVRCVEID